jgi:RNA polymerase sigma-70 factor (ECF subfamily)
VSAAVSFGLVPAPRWAALTPRSRPWERGRALSAPQPAASDEARFAEAAREHTPLLRALARKLCRDDAEASDLLQDTFERALRAWPSLPPGANIRAWMVTIQHNLFIDRCRRRKVRGTMASIDDVQVAAPEPAPAAPWQDLTGDQIAAAVARLPDEFRQVYQGHLDGRSYDELARELGIPKNTVGTRLLRARKRLRELLTETLGDKDQAS